MEFLHKNKERIVCVVFLATIFLFFGYALKKGRKSLMAAWRNPAKAFADMEKHPGETFSLFERTSALIRATAIAWNPSTAQRTFFVDLHGLVQKWIGRHVVRGGNEEQTVYLGQNGYLYMPAHDIPSSDIARQKEEMIAIHEYLSQKDILFLDVIAPSKTPRGNERLFPGVSDPYNEVMDELIRDNGNRRDSAIDLRDLISAENRDWDSLFYRADNHWTIDAAFWAHAKVVSLLEKRLNLDAERTERMTDLDNYDKIRCENCFWGAYGDKVGVLFAGGPEHFDYYLPRFDTDLQVRIQNTAHRNGRLCEYRGPFEKSVVRTEEIETAKRGMSSNAFSGHWYFLYFGNVQSRIDIVNPAGRGKVLVVQDSFGLPFSAFLSLHVRELTAVDPRYYDTTIRALAEEKEYDAVVFITGSSYFHGWVRLDAPSSSDRAYTASAPSAPTVR